MATKPITFPNERASEPHFIKAAQEIAAEMMNFSTEELEETLKINSKLANQNWLRYQHFLQAGDTSHAALAFTGMAYKHLKASSFNQEDIGFANQHLWITSFLYTGGITKRENEVKGIALVFSELRKGMER